MIIRWGIARLCGTMFACCLLWPALVMEVKAQGKEAGITAETVLKYLSKDVFLSPGVGFQKVKIGHNLKQVSKTWGLPNKGLESAETGSVVWIYRAAGSEIVLTGTSIVKTIKVAGKVGSPFSSSQGAQFGMTPHQVISIYGPPGEAEGLKELRYPEKGIEFGFAHGGMNWMRVFSPDS